MYEKFIGLILKIENNNVISSVRRGLIILIPVLTAGSLATVLNGFPVSVYRHFITTFGGGFLSDIFVFVSNVTLGLISAYLVLSITFFYSRVIEPGDDNIVHTCAMITAFASFVALFQKSGQVIDISCFNAGGIFFSIVAAIIATRIFHFLKAFFKKPIKYYSSGADERFRYAVLCILPTCMVILIFTLLNSAAGGIFDGQTLNELFSRAFVALFRSIDSKFVAGIVCLFIIHVSWFFGIHGGNLINEAAVEIFQPLDMAADSILSKLFIDTFALFGGSGSTLCLIIAMLVFSESRNDKKLAKSALPFAVFNVNEFLLFGFPVILNPVMMLPFIFVPIVSYVIAYALTVVEFVPVAHTAESLSWTTPALISGYLSTDSVKGVIVQIFIVFCGTALYVPFIKLYGKIHERREIESIQKLTDIVKADLESGRRDYYLERTDEIGDISKVIVSRLKMDIEDKKIPVFYQPILDSAGRVYSAEALLRWRYKDFTLFPPLVVMLAQDDCCFEELTQVILEVAVKDVRKVSLETGQKMKFSVNISAEQLNNVKFVEKVISIVNSANVNEQIFLEVTEDSSLENLYNIKTNIDKLSDNSIGVYIDDFSMGSTSIKYLQNNSFMTVKLDGQLVREIVVNSRSRNIARSIVELGRELGFDVVAEYVETEEMREILLGIGVKYLQGYLYSPAINKENLSAFVKARQK